MHPAIKFIRRLLLVVTIIAPFTAFGQGQNTTFGQNRLPYKKTDWKLLSTEDVDAYYYEGGQNLAAYAQLTAAEYLSDIEDFFSYRAGGKIEILVFNCIEDLRESNTGLQEQLFNVGGYTYVIDNKVIAYYNGIHSDFEKQIKRGIAEIILSEMIYGNSLQERVQSSSLLFLPSWFFKGLTSYVSDPWNPDLDSRIRDGILSGKFKNLNWLSEEEAVLAGHSIWNYIVRQHGQKAIPEILYVTRISKGFDAAFTYALGQNSSALIDEWFAYYQNIYRESEAERTVPRKLLNIPDKISGYPHTQLKTHPSGRRVAFVMNKNGFWQVKIFDKREKSEFTVLKGGKHEGYQVINYNYPLLAWEPNGRSLGVLYYAKGKTHLVKIDRNNKVSERYIISDKIDQVLSFDFAEDNTLLISAIKNGQTDLYLYELKSGELTQLTNDIYDDMWPRFNTDQSQIIFSSNRPTDSLALHDEYFGILGDESTFDVFLYDYKGKNNHLQRITNTPGVNEVLPVFYLPGFFSFVSDISGIYNAYACKDTVAFSHAMALIKYSNGRIDTLHSQLQLPHGQLTKLLVNDKMYRLGDTVYRGIDTLTITGIEARNILGSSFNYYPLTNYKRNILGRDMASTDDAEYNLLLYDNRYQIFETNVSEDVEKDAEYINIVPTEYRIATGINFYYGDEVPSTAVIIDVGDTGLNNTTPVLPSDSFKLKNADTGLYRFQTDFPDDFILNYPQKKAPGTGLMKSQARQEKFSTIMFPDYYVAQLDNSIINTYYHLNNTGTPSVFANMNIMFQVKTSISDLLGNHRINAGVRYPFSLNGSDYFLEYQNRKHKINWDVKYFRQSRRIEQSTITRVLINEFRTTFKLPVNETVSVRTHFFGRQDRSILLGTDSSTLSQPDVYYNWAGTKAELVFDNTKNIDINLPYGTRFKIFGEYFQNIGAGNRQVINLGIDYRKYIKLHNKIIWASRFSFNTSVGPDKVQYFIGGVENWIGPSFNSAVGRDQGSQYIFQSLANSFRGFRQNIRNGNSYALINTEVRFPVASYVTQKPVRADYLRNFLLVPFLDIGTAWYGTSPFKSQPYNTTVTEGSNYIVTVTNSENPIVASTGIGARTRLFGYYLRLDFAWGIQNGRFLKNMAQFALGYDF